MLIAGTCEIIARHYHTGEGHLVICRHGVIKSIEPADAPSNTWYAPSIFDPQVNGYAGADFQSDGLSTDDLQKAVAGLHADGCSRWLLMNITDDFDDLIARLGHLKNLRDADARLRQSIVG